MYINPVASLGLCLLLAAAGCMERDPNVPDLYPVSGVVTLDGKPLPRAVVELTPVGSTKGTPSFGITDSEGKFELQSVQGRQGVPEGEFSVIISKLVRPDGAELPEFVEDMMLEPHKQLLPDQYSDREKSQLTATVASGGRDDLDFSLQSRNK